MPADKLTGLAVEYGTVDSKEVIHAMRFDNWINVYEKPGTLPWQEGKQAIKDGLYCDNDLWKEKVWGRAKWVLTHTCAGLAQS